jgi:hypothetical protein
MKQVSPPGMKVVFLPLPIPYFPLSTQNLGCSLGRDALPHHIYQATSFEQRLVSDVSLLPTVREHYTYKKISLIL